MSTHDQTPTDTYRCPACGGILSFTEGAWGCGDCRYVPRHGAD